jgi:hypothetical protein
MDKKLRFALPLLVLLCFGSFGLVFAQDWTPGVHGGNSFTYDITGSWSSASSNFTIPQNFIDIQKTASYQVNITLVDGSNVTLSTDWRFTNGTDSPSINVVDVSSGTSYYGGYWALIAGNLGQSATLHPNGDDGLTINRTISKSYSSGNRDTNVLDLSYFDYNSTYQSNRTENLVYYFDKATGMLVGLSDDTEYTNPTIKGSIVWTLKSSNVWNVSGMPIHITIIIAIAVSIVVIVSLTLVYRIRTQRRRKHRRARRVK